MINLLAGAVVSALLAGAFYYGAEENSTTGHKGATLTCCLFMGLFAAVSVVCGAAMFGVF